ncbi:MAG: beta-lactamase family protein, partial [Candidatus Aminicenantes bacterium]|nr:beta-lactamase family protein [Candidatus Aminicenantes bacterium]
MKEKNITGRLIVVLLSALVLFNLALNADQANKETKISLTELEKKVTEFMAEGDIPGLSLVVIRGGKPDYIKSFGFADLEAKKPVTADTLFEIASCSKAFTALAALKLEQEGMIDLDAPVSRYLPWFYAAYKGDKKEITLRQCLHQTSGIPFKSISRIPARDDDAALLDTVKNLAGIELADLPGKKHEYATVNYDIIGAVIEAVSGMPYEEYMAKNIFPGLGLQSTSVG